jgi:dTDP-3-amino-3,4,6-trideoxy-alpha-D-glucose transaminase
VRSDARERLAHTLQASGVGSLIHYPIACHRQAVYATSRVAALSLPVAEGYADEVLSLPIGPHLTADQVERVAGIVRGSSLAEAA